MVYYKACTVSAKMKMLIIRANVSRLIDPLAEAN